MSNSIWMQRLVIIDAKPRGFHLVTDEILRHLDGFLNRFEIGLGHLFIQHTSASLAINENADSSVRSDMEAYFDRVVPEDESYFTHTLEGKDDMPAHLKSVLIGCDLTVPISKGKLALGYWQGIYLCEHRNHGGKRKIMVTLSGKEWNK